MTKDKVMYIKGQDAKSFTDMELVEMGTLYREISTLREARNKIIQSHNSLIEIIEQDIDRCYKSLGKIGTKEERARLKSKE